jgi:hypothetical protein
MLQKDKAFQPHLLIVTVGSTVDFPNLDPVFHNAFSNYDGQLFDVGLYPPGSTRSIRFSRPGVVRVFCNIHSSMSAVIVVLDSPLFGITKPDGRYEIDGAPEGTHDLTFFHERATEAALSRCQPARRPSPATAFRFRRSPFPKPATSPFRTRTSTVRITRPRRVSAGFYPGTHK